MDHIANKNDDLNWALFQSSSLLPDVFVYLGQYCNMFKQSKIIFISNPENRVIIALLVDGLWGGISSTFCQNHVLWRSPR